MPKWLNTINNLQTELCKSKGLSKSGDYSFYASYLESEGVDEKFPLLIDMGIPSSTINKINHLVPRELKGQELINFVKNIEKDKPLSLMTYEIEKLDQL